MQRFSTFATLVSTVFLIAGAFALARSYYAHDVISWARHDGGLVISLDASTAKFAIHKCVSSSRGEWTPGFDYYKWQQDSIAIPRRPGIVSWEHFGIGYGEWNSQALEMSLVRVDAVVFPMWILIAVSAFLPGRWLIVNHRDRIAMRRSKLGLCPHCGYDVRATPDRCSECGHNLLAVDRK